MQNIIKLENEKCTISYDSFTKSIYVFGLYGTQYFKSKNETTRGIKKAFKELTILFNNDINIYQIVDFLCNNQKIRMTFSLA